MTDRDAALDALGQVSVSGERILLVLAEYSAAHGMPPTADELAGAVGLTKSAVAYQLRRLTSLGLLRKLPRLFRSRVLTDAGHLAVEELQRRQLCG